MSNYTKKIALSEVLLTPNQVDFIKKVHQRYFNTAFIKNNLFFLWDNIPDEIKIDKKVFKSIEHYENMKRRALSCGSFTEYKAVKNDDRIKLFRANFCKKDKICLSCAVNRAYNQQKKFFQALEVYPYENDDDLLSKHWYYIVTPVRHSKTESLEVVYNRVDRLRKSVLMQIRDGKRGKSKGFWSRFKGGMGSIEFTYTEKNGWNVHINWLVNSNFIVPVKEVFDGYKIWYQNDDLRAFLKRFNNSYIHSINKLDFSDRELIRDNLLEILKYSLKFSSLNPAQLVEVYYKLYRKRLFFTFGNLRGLDLESVDVTLGDDINENDEFFRLIYERMNNFKYRLSCIC